MSNLCQFYVNLKPSIICNNFLQHRFDPPPLLQTVILKGDGFPNSMSSIKCVWSQSLSEPGIWRPNIEKELSGQLKNTFGVLELYHSDIKSIIVVQVLVWLLLIILIILMILIIIVIKVLVWLLFVLLPLRRLHRTLSNCNSHLLVLDKGHFLCSLCSDESKRMIWKLLSF